MNETTPHKIGRTKRAAAPPNAAGAIEALVARHEVAFERWREYATDGGARRPVGSSIRLSGINTRHQSGGLHGFGHPVPGCALCREAYDELARLARLVIPNGPTGAPCRVKPFDYAYHIAPRSRGGREEVVLTIFIDAGDRGGRAAAEIGRRLKSLGVLEGRVNPAFAKKAG